MSTITNSSNSSLLILREDSPGVLPSPATYKNIRFTGITLEPSLQTEMSDEITKNIAVTDLIPTGTEAGGDTNHEISYGVDFDFLFEEIFRGSFDGTDLLASNNDTTCSIMKIIENSNNQFAFRYNKAKVDSATFNLGVDNAKDNMSITWTAASEALMPEYAIFTQVDTDPIDYIGRENAIWLNETDKSVFQYSDGTWADTGYTFETTATWTTGSGAGTGGADKDWHIDTDTGDFWYNDTTVWELAFTLLPSGSAWYSGVIAPVVGAGDKDDFYIDTVLGTLWQKIFDGSTSTWTMLMDTKNVTNPTGLYYQDIAITASNTTNIMSFPELRGVVIDSSLDTEVVTLSEEEHCFDDFTFTIANNTDRVKGICTGTADYPNLEAIGTTAGRREITGNLQLILGKHITLYQMMLKGQPISLSFKITNGTSGYQIDLPKVKFNGANANPAGNNETLKIPFTWQALYDSTTGTDIKITKLATL